MAHAVLRRNGFARYSLALVEAETMRPTESAGPALMPRIVAAARLGRVWLLDNVLVG